MTGYTSQELIGRPLAALSGPHQTSDANSTEAPFLEVSGITEAPSVARDAGDTGTTPVALEVWHHKDGRSIDVRVSRCALDTDDAPAGAQLLVVDDVTERKRQAALSQRLASVDPVTGLRQRAAFEHLLDEAVARSHAGGKPAGLLLLSLQASTPAPDGGPPTLPDSVLQETARRLRAHLRSNDVIGRLGASDFGVLLSGLASQQGADVVLDKLGRLLVPLLAEAISRDLPVQASWGLAWGLEPGEQASDLLTRADRASRPLMPVPNEGAGASVSASAPIAADMPSGTLP
jgi:diguanylate cyclase (GGDEF)-like protein